MANVRWVWHLSARTFDDERADSWYPGDRFVDVVAASGYSWSPGRPSEPYRGLGRIFGRSYLWAVAHDKPFMIGETGAQEDPADPERKARWFTRAAEVLQNWPGVTAFCYFHSDRRYPWWVHSSTRSFDAYRAIAHSSPFV